MRLRPNRRRFVATPETILALTACCFVVHENGVFANFDCTGVQTDRAPGNWVGFTARRGIRYT
jgi:hypothetical protein